jgi:hypothetical protein
LPREAAATAEAQLLAAQQSLLRHLWKADQMAQGLTDPAQLQELTRAGQAVGGRNRETLRQHGREALGSQADRLAARGEVPGRGPDLETLARSGRTYYQVVEDATTTARPLSLVAEEGLAWRRSLAATGLLVCFLLLVWVLSSYPTFVTVAHLFWPEQAVLLGLVGLQTFGPTWPVIFLLVLGIVARVLSVGGALLSLFQRGRKTRRPAFPAQSG